MDPWAPIQGISLERYAELAAEVDGVTDPEREAEVIGRLGVPRADWEAAKGGWTARMQDPSLMGQVATRFVPAYQAALTKRKPAAVGTFEDYVAMSGAAAALGYQGMLAHYGIGQGEWTQIAGHWNGIIPTNPQYMQFGILVEQEAARIRSGGAPKARGAGAAAGASAAAGAHGQPHAAQPQAWQQQQQAWAQQHAQQAASFDRDVGNAFSALGNAFNQAYSSVAMSVGSRVLVQWSDGNKYPATVTQMAPGQVHVTFPNGQQHWVPAQYVSLT